MKVRTREMITVGADAAVASIAKDINVFAVKTDEWIEDDDEYITVPRSTNIKEDIKHQHQSNTLYKKKKIQIKLEKYFEKNKTT